MTTKIIKVSSNRLVFIRLRNILLSINFLLFAILEIERINIYLENIFGDIIAYVFLSIIIVSLILIVIFHILARRKQHVGILNLHEKYFTINQNNSIFTVDIKQLSNYAITTNYFNTEEKSTGLASSYNNWLQFEYKNNEYKYQFVIESNFIGNQFENLIDNWKNNDNFTLKYFSKNKLQ